MGAGAGGVRPGGGAAAGPPAGPGRRGAEGSVRAEPLLGPPCFASERWTRTAGAGAGIGAGAVTGAEGGAALGAEVGVALGAEVGAEAAAAVGAAEDRDGLGGAVRGVGAEEGVAGVEEGGADAADAGADEVADAGADGAADAAAAPLAAGAATVLLGTAAGSALRCTVFGAEARVSAEGAGRLRGCTGATRGPWARWTEGPCQAPRGP